MSSFCNGGNETGYAFKCKGVERCAEYKNKYNGNQYADDNDFTVIIDRMAEFGCASFQCRMRATNWILTI